MTGVQSKVRRSCVLDSDSWPLLLDDKGNVFGIISWESRNGEPAFTDRMLPLLFRLVPIDAGEKGKFVGRVNTLEYLHSP